MGCVLGDSALRKILPQEPRASQDTKQTRTATRRILMPWSEGAERMEMPKEGCLYKKGIKFGKKNNNNKIIKKDFGSQPLLFLNLKDGRNISATFICPKNLQNHLKLSSSWHECSSGAIFFSYSTYMLSLQPLHQMTKQILNLSLISFLNMSWSTQLSQILKINAAEKFYCVTSH